MAFPLSEQISQTSTSLHVLTLLLLEVPSPIRWRWPLVLHVLDHNRMPQVLVLAPYLPQQCDPLERS